MYKFFTPMSKPKTSTSKKPARPAVTPMIGSLLRMPHEVVMARMLAALNSNGFDITLTELGLFLYPGPDGRRPIDLARQCNLTRQAMNYVLAGLEHRGYIERRAGISAAARVVRVTDRGWEMIAQIRNCLAAIEQEWTAHLGAQRFKALRETLHDLSLWLGKLT
jgi:DNA-binding MarR family transcriptional regulator